MRVINIGNRYEIYDDNLQIHHTLPADAYIVRFDKMSGFYLEKHNDIEIKEDKIYGKHLQKVDKVLNSFSVFNRNLGVILSGNKGIGKSLFAKLLANKAIENGIPLIIVDKFMPGIATYIERIEQEVVVLFDEFDKTFANITTGENEANPQTGLLSLFDGVATGKKLYVITCNDLHKLNDYLINRPGRFHYHFRFDYPEAEEIEIYLKDKLKPEFHSEINEVILFARKVNLNYDCLRAIAFEINNGEKFKDAILDLNIVNLDRLYYSVKLICTDGSVFTSERTEIDLFDHTTRPYIWVTDTGTSSTLAVEFDVAYCKYDTTGAVLVDGEHVRLDIDEDDYYNNDEGKRRVQALTPDKVIITKVQSKNLHYLV